MTSDEDDECPSFLWYFVASFGYTILILIILIAYLIMYSSHFMWALSKKKEPKLKKSTDKTARTGTDSKGSRESLENKDSNEGKGSKGEKDDKISTETMDGKGDKEIKDEKGNKESKEDEESAGKQGASTVR